MSNNTERFKTQRENEKIKRLNLVKSTFYNETQTKERLIEFIKNSEILSMNSKCLEFEVEYAKYMSQKYSVSFNSGSSANLAIIQTYINLGVLKKGDKVGFSALTWATNVMPIIQLGLEPIPIDIEIETLNISSEKFLKALQRTPDIKMLFITNVLGFCGDIDIIESLCEQKDILFVEDNCESIGSVYKGRKLGGFGAASTMSFYVGHHLSAIEGGIVSTDDTEVYNTLQMVRSHGWNRCLDEGVKKQLRKTHNVDEFFDRYTFYDLAYNLRPTEITGFLGLESLQYIEEIVQKREDNFYRFYNTIKDKEDIVNLNIDNLNTISNFAFPIIFNNKISFEKYKERFLNNGIEIRPIVGGNMAKQPFFKKYSNQEWILPNSDTAHNLGFYFPNNPELTEQEIELILTLLA
jgi:CDP-4-dehydro-6-deoxyglucose reductase, E1